MARPALPPRLVCRKGTWYLIDTACGVRLSLHTKDEAVAKSRLTEYALNKGAYAPQQEPLLRELLEGYRRGRLDALRDRANSTARQIAMRAGISEEVADEQGQLAADAVADTGTLEHNINALNRHIGDIRVQAITSEVARNYRDLRRGEGKRNRCKGRVSDGTIRRELSVIKAALSWAMTEGPTVWFGDDRVAPDFAYSVAQSLGRPEFLDHDEIAKLIVQCKEPHLRLYILMAIQTGARKKAILDLRWHDVDFKRRVIDFGLVDHNKRKPIVRMTDILYNALLLAFSCRTINSTHVIEYHGRPIGNVKKGFRDLVIACGFDPKRVTPHVLKHSYISWLCQAGMLVSEIAAYANTTVKTIEEHYQHLLADRSQQVEQAVSIDFSRLGLDADLLTVRIAANGQAIRHLTRAEMEHRGLLTANTSRRHRMASDCT